MQGKLFRGLSFLILATFAILGIGNVRPAAAGPPIGMNIEPIDDWGRDFIFADAIKQARFWKDAVTGNPAAADSNGWPTVDAQLGLWFGAVNPLNGTYGLSFTGQATVSAVLGTATVSNQVYNAGTNTTTATVVIPTGQEGALEINFVNTKRLATDTPGTGITNVKLMRPTTEGGTTPCASNVTFLPGFKALMSKFSVLRFMQTTATIGSQSVNWSDRTPATWWSQSSAAFDGTIVTHCISWEYIIQLCNEMGRDPWITLPRFATDDYMTKVAQVFKYGSDGINPYTSVQANPVFPPLNPGLHCYVEYSNENWNYSPGELANMGNAEINSYPITTNGLCASITNGPLSSVAGLYTTDHGGLLGGNGVSAGTGVFPGGTSVSQPNYFRDVVFNNGANTSVFTSQTPATTGTDNAGGDELGMKFKSTQAGTITAIKYYKPVGETGSHTGNLWVPGAPNGVQACYLLSGGVPAAVSQSLTFPATGSYTVKYYASTVPGNTNTSIQISIDGVNVGTPIATTSGFVQYTSASFTISTIGSHTLQVANTATAANQSAFLDLVTVQGAGSVTVANNSFESPTVNPAAWQGPASWGGVWNGGFTLVWADPGSSQFATKLGSIAFSGESSSGWQSATLSPAVSIAANTTYIVSVNSNTTYGVTNTTQIGPLTWDGNTGQGYNRKWVERAVQMSNIFRTVFGDSAMPGTSSNPIIRPTLMMLASGGWIDNYTYTDLRYLQDYFNNQAALTAVPDGPITTAHPPTYYFWGGGGAPYYDPAGTYDINSVWTTGDWDTTHFANLWLAGTANYYLPQWGHFISYEGGPELPDSGSLSQSIWNDARMESLETSHQTAYNQYGGDLWVYYTTTNIYRWGFTDDIYNLAAPKLIGIDQINASTQAVSTYGAGIPGTIAASTTVPAFGAPNLANMTATAYHMDYAGYVVSNGSASVFNIGLSAGSSGASNLADIYVDGVLAGTITIPNTGSNTTYGTSATVATPSLAIGSHGIMVKAKSGSFGLNALLITGGTATIPNPPTGLTATSTYQQIGLTWTGSTGATSYSVYRGTTAGGESGTAIATGLIVTNYTNTGLVNGTTYYYTVKAVNTAGTSGASNEVSATPVDNVAHLVNATTAPTIDGANTDACWTAATSYPITLLDGGTITNGSDCSGSFKGAWDATNLYLLADVTDDVKTNDSVNSYDDDGVEVFVDGDNSKGTSYDSDDVQYLFGWNDAAAGAGTNAGSKMTGVTMGQANPTGTTYRIEMKIPWASIGTTAASAKLTGLDLQIDDDDDGGARDGALNWKDASGVAWTNPSVFGIARLDPAAGGPPAAPTGLTATAGNTQVALSWTASSGATTYNVLRSTISGSGYASVATGIVPVSYTNTGLTNGTTYYFVVTATNASGTSGNSNQASATPVSGGGTLLASEPFASALGKLDGAGGGTGWSAAWFTQSNDAAIPGYNVVNTTPLTFSTLQTSANYGVGGSGFQSTGRAFDVSAGGPFGTNGYLSGGLIGANGKTLWMSILMRKDVSNQYLNYIALHNGPVEWAGGPGLSVGYYGAPSETAGTKYWSINLGGTVTKSNVAITIGATALLVARIDFGATTTLTLYVNPATLGGAAPGTSNAVASTTSNMAYRYLMYYGGDFSGNSSIDEMRFGDTYAVVTPATVAPPAAPTGLTATPGNAQVALSWTASSGATAYDVKRSTVSGSGYVTVSSPTVTNYTNTGLTNGTTYYFVVDAKNAGGTSANSAQASATPVAPPAAPTGLMATAGNAQAILSWMASGGATAYDVKRSTVSGSGYVTVSSPTATSYTNTGLTNGTTYYYVVDAKNVGGTSANSAQVSVTPTATNLALNPGFETGTASPWSPWQNAAIINTNAHTGTYCTQLIGTASFEQILSGLTPNHTYTVSGWAKNAVAGDSVYVGVKNFGGTEVNQATTGTTYAFLTVTFTTGATNTTATIYGYRSTATANASYTDDFTVN